MVSDDEGAHVTFICPPGDSYHQRVGIDPLGRDGMDRNICNTETKQLLTLYPVLSLHL